MVRSVIRNALSAINRQLLAKDSIVTRLVNGDTRRLTLLVKGVNKGSRTRLRSRTTAQATATGTQRTMVVSTRNIAMLNTNKGHRLSSLIKRGTLSLSLTTGHDLHGQSVTRRMRIIAITLGALIINGAGISSRITQKLATGTYLTGTTRTRLTANQGTNKSVSISLFIQEYTTLAITNLTKVISSHTFTITIKAKQEKLGLTRREALSHHRVTHTITTTTLLFLYTLNPANTITVLTKNGTIVTSHLFTPRYHLLGNRQGKSNRVTTTAALATVSNTATNATTGRQQRRIIRTRTTGSVIGISMTQAAETINDTMAIMIDALLLIKGGKVNLIRLFRLNLNLKIIQGIQICNANLL